MASRGVCFARLIFFFIFFAIFVLHSGGVFRGGFLGGAFAQELGETTTNSSSQTSATDRGRNRHYPKGQSKWNWNQRGRAVPPGESAARLRLRAYRQKMALRAQSAAANSSSTLPSASFSTSPPKRSLGGAPGAVVPQTAWVPLGPAPLASDATGDGQQDYDWVSGRATSVVIDPADSTGNTVLLGGAYGGLWKSTNAASLSPSPASVTWQALIDDQPTLAVGAIALQPLNSNVILVGTGETNSSDDSYYGLGILRSTNAGSTWTQITGIGQPPDQSFLGIGFSKLAFSTANSNLVVAAAAGDNGLCLGDESAAAGNSGPCLGPQEDGNSPARGLYYSVNAGATWSRATLTDGAIAASATSVIYNSSQGAFYASIRRHGIYSSTDGVNFSPLATQPTAGLTPANCPPSSNALTCPIFRGEFAVVPGRNEMYVWIIDVQYDNNGNPTPVDDGIWRSATGGAHWTLIPDNGITNCGDVVGGCGVEQGWYNLALAAIPDGSATDVYAGAVNLYKCTLAGGTVCTEGDWINLTHAYGCNPWAEPAHVHPNQHGIAFAVASGMSPGYFAHDGGISRTLDGYSGLTTGSCSGTNQFDSLSETLGSMTEFVSVSVHPSSADIILGGTANNGSPKTSTATSSSTWQNALSGDGGFTAINPTNSSEWFAANPYVSIMKCESATGTGSDCNDTTFVQVVGSNDLNGDQGAYVTPYILDPQNSGEMLVGTCRVWRIGTSGTAPQQLSNDFDTLGTGVCTGDEINLVTALAAGGPANENNNDSETVYAVTNGYGPLSGSPGGEVWATTDAGFTLMTNVTRNINPQGYAISSVAMDSSVPSGNTAYVGIMGFSTPAYPTSHVWKTTNAGASWTDWTGTGLPDAPVNALLVDASATPSRVYAGTDVGVFVSATTAAGWTEVGPQPGPSASGFLPNAPVTALRIFNDGAGTKTLVASTYGRGIWSFPLAPDYINVISDSPQTVFPAQAATFNGTLTSQAGYASLVNLSCTNEEPALTTCTLNPTQITPTAAYTVTAAGTVGDYTFNAQAVGTDPYTITKYAAATLHVVDFNLTAPTPNSLSVAQSGISGASTFQVTAAGSFAETVSLSCSGGLPAGAACVFSPSSSVHPVSSSPVTVTLAVTAAAGTPLGGPTAVTISAMAVGAPAAKTQTFALTVTPAADFAIAVTASPNATVVNQNVTWNGTLTALHGYSGSVALTCTAGAPGTCGITPPTVTPTAAGAPFTVTLGSATPGTFTFTIQGTDGTLTHSTPTETLAVTVPDLTWTDTGNATATALAGQGASYTFSAVPLGGSTFSSAVSFACTNLPALTSCGFSPASITAGAGTTAVTLTISSTGPNTAAQLKKAVLRTAATVKDGPSYPFMLLMVAGIVGMARRRSGNPRFYMDIGWIFLAIGLLLLIACGGIGGGSTPPPVVTVTVSPGSATLFANEPGNSWPASVTQKQFTATVNNSTNQSVAWAVTGRAANGTVDATGLYTAPPVAPNPARVTVTATSALAASPGSSAVTVQTPTAVGTSQVTVTAAAVGGASHGDVVTLIVQ